MLKCCVFYKSINDSVCISRNARKTDERKRWWYVCMNILSLQLPGAAKKNYEKPQSARRLPPPKVELAG
jgi:hypothetical protein